MVVSKRFRFHLFLRNVQSPLFTRFTDSLFPSSSFRHYSSASSKPNLKLIEIGKLNLPAKEDYKSGQVFLHKIFGYRGVILYPWTAKVYTKPVAPKEKPRNSRQTEKQSKNVGELPRQDGAETTETYYQVLIHEDDWPFLRMPRDEGFTLLGQPDGESSLYTIRGMDFISHEDVLPFFPHNANVQPPIKHQLFSNFLTPAPNQDPSFVPLETLTGWQEKMQSYLELSSVNRDTTRDVLVTVIPFYVGRRENLNGSAIYFWRYSVRLENHGEETVTLRERKWKIFSLSGHLEMVKGRGVVGYEPRLNRINRAFQYSSHVSLQAPSGHMWGEFTMELENGQTFECRIPAFGLNSKLDDSHEDAS